MKKITPYILIFFIFVNLFAPVSLELSNNKIAINKNKIEAVDEIKLKGFITRNDTSITVYAAVNFENDSWRTSNEKVVIILSDSNNKVISLQGPSNTVINATKMAEHPILGASQELLPTEVKTAISDTTTTKFYKKVITGLKSNTTYLVSMYATHTEVSWWTIAATGVGVVTIIISAGVGTPLVIAAGTAIAGGAAVVAGETVRITNDENTLVMDPPVSITTNPAGITQNITANANVTATNRDPSSMPPCSMNPLSNSGTFMGCIAQGFYYVLFQPTSYLFALSGTLFDNAFAYSVDDHSYRSPFVVEGWKVVRDFCNMFFIFILLYIAFGTILNLNGVKTKEMIINVVLIGIFINFSLFASQVIIDASNILARVFYNSNTITVKINDPSVGSNVIPLSAALVNKINPQEIILSASQVSAVQGTRGKGGGATDTTANADTNISTGTFILVTLLATIVNGVGIFVFFSISIIFIARVIGLWLAMILVPFAFLSYTVPAMQDFEMVGWKKWWPETIKLAFLAPVFIFFLYLILKFIETGFMIVQNDAQPVGLNLMIGIILPFVFIMILLLKAKSVATTMSGKIGETITKAASSVGKVALGAGGIALGAATGGAAFLARGTIGRLGSSVMNNDKLREDASKKGFAGFRARALRNVGEAASKGSFDARSTKLAGLAGKTTGMKFGEAKGKGGFEQKKTDQKEKLLKKAKALEVGEDSPLKHDLHAKEESLKKLETEKAFVLSKENANVDLKKKALDDADIAKRNNPNDQSKIDAYKKAEGEYNDAKSDRTKISMGGVEYERDTKGNKIEDGVDADGKTKYKETGRYNTDNGLITQDEVDANEKTANESKDNESSAIANTSKVTKEANDTYDEAENKAKEIENSTGEKAEESARQMVSQAEDKATRASAAFSSAKLALQTDPKNKTMIDNLEKAEKASENADKQLEAAEKKAITDVETAKEKATEASKTSIEEAKTTRLDTITKAEKAQKAATEKATDDRTKADKTNALASKGTGKSIKNLKFEDVPMAQQNLDNANNERRVNISNRYKSKSNKALNLILSGGQYSTKTADHAAHAVIMDIKSEGTK